MALMHWLAAASAAALLPAAAFAAGPQQGRLTGSIGVGVEAFGGGDLHGGARGRAASLQALNPALPAVPADLNIEAREYGDVYDAPLAITGELAYGLSDQIELVGAVSYSAADEGRVRVGSAFVPALNATLPVFGRFGELNTLSVEAGARFYPGGDGAIRPFVGGRAGFVRQDEVRATLTIPDAPAGGITLSNVPFFHDTTMLTASVEGGVAGEFGEAVSGGLSVAARYIGEADGDDSAIGGLGLASINDGTERWTFPVQARLSLRF
jgi:hypothetical protein